MPSGRRPARAPSSELADLRREVDQLFARLAELERGTPAEAGSWSPPLDVFECDGSLVVVTEVPGLGPDALEVEVRAGELLIGGERRERRPSGARSFVCMERAQGRFERRLTLGAALDVSRARAELHGGLLRVTIPRLRERRGSQKSIPIERGA